MMVTVIGRGHSGTRAISHTLSESGVYMGSEINGSGDLIPPFDMYDACRVFARHVKYCGNLEWDFSEVNRMDIDPDFIELINSYLASVLDSNDEHRGWKLPETTLVYPWIARMFPDIRYIYWVRDPRDCVLGLHGTDDLGRFDVEYDRTDDVRRSRAISWKYQSLIVEATPRPKHFLTVRFEDFVLKQEETLAEIEEFLGIPLAKIEVRAESVGRWKTDEDRPNFDFLSEELKKHNYIS